MHLLTVNRFQSINRESYETGEDFSFLLRMANKSGTQRIRQKPRRSSTNEYTKTDF